MERIYEDEFGGDDGAALEGDGGPAGIIEVVHDEHVGVDEGCKLREEPFEVGEEGRVIERPRRGVLDGRASGTHHGRRGAANLIVPTLHVQRVGDGEPVAVDFEVGGFAGASQHAERGAREEGQTMLGAGAA